MRKTPGGTKTERGGGGCEEEGRVQERERDRVERERLLKEGTMKEEEEAARKKAELEKRE